ncbi:hypothetical protein [Streptomyces sp. NBC_00354]|uniref:hypothetical protein n=1 Tax=Streptomyces sp. NBC_00354 TaxID=2975723 RepID=UPI003FA6F2FC
MRLSPGTRRQHRRGGSVRRGAAQWRSVLANRLFLLFSVAMIGSCVLTFQVYLALPLAAGGGLGDTAGTRATTGLFVVAAAVAVLARSGRLASPARELTPASG